MRTELAARSARGSGLAFPPLLKSHSEQENMNLAGTVGQRSRGLVNTGLLPVEPPTPWAFPHTHPFAHHMVAAWKCLALRLATLQLLSSFLLAQLTAPYVKLAFAFEAHIFFPKKKGSG